MVPQDQIGKHVRIADRDPVEHALRGKTGVIFELTTDGITGADYFMIDLDTIPENDEFFGSRVLVVVDVEDASEIGQDAQSHGQRSAATAIVVFVASALK